MLDYIISLLDELSLDDIIEILSILVKALLALLMILLVIGFNNM